MRIISISAKCSDMFSASFKDDKSSKELYGYVPDWFPNNKVNHYGDYVQLDIDIDTGKIINWKTPSVKDLNDFK